MSAGTGVLSSRICLAALALRDDVEFAQVLIGGFAESLPGFQLTAAEFSAQLEIPVFGELLGFGEAFFLC